MNTTTIVNAIIANAIIACLQVFLYWNNFQGQAIARLASIWLGRNAAAHRSTPNRPTTHAWGAHRPRRHSLVLQQLVLLPQLAQL